MIQQSLAHPPRQEFTCCRALGDVFSQKIEGAKQVDLKRSLLTSVYGAAFIGKWQLCCKDASTPPSNNLQDSCAPSFATVTLITQQRYLLHALP